MVQVPFAEGEKSRGETSMDSAVWLIDRLGYPHLFRAVGHSLAERS